MRSVAKWVLGALAVLFAVLALVNVVGGLADSSVNRSIPGTLVVGLVPASIAALIWYFGVRRLGAPSAGSKALDRMAAEATEYFQTVIAAREFPKPRPIRLLDTPGEPLLAVCDARLLELRRKTVRVGLGTRIKVAGTPFYVGRSDPITRTELQQMSQGELGITATRLIFSGALRSADFELARVVAVDVMSDAISVSVTGRQNPVYLQVSNPLLWGQLVRAIKQVRLEGRRLAPDQQIALG